MNRRRTGALAAIGLLAVAACSGGDDDEGALAASGATAPAGGALSVPAAVAAVPPDASTLGAVTFTAQPVADIQKATAMATRPSDGSMYVTAQTGQVHRLLPGGPATVVQGPAVVVRGRHSRRTAAATSRQHHTDSAGRPRPRAPGAMLPAV